MQKILFTLILTFFTVVASFAQTGTIKGQIIDTTLNESVIGANVVIKGTNIGGATDVEGNYLITNVQPGTYTLVISSIGYIPKEIDGVQVQAGKVTLVNLTLKEESKQLQDVVVQAQRETYSEISVISEIKLAQVVAVGISGEQISKTQDSDGAQVLRRLPGVSLFDDRFIMVRGLGERYNSVLLNGALAPSTEVDVRSFSFDLIPSSVIDRMFVLKSGSPELPGEYAGGIIKVFTKNAPDENFTDLSVSAGFRVGTLGQTMQRYQGSSTDWLGFDNGNRKLPDAFPADLRGQNPSTRLEATRQLNTTWIPETYTALPDFKVSLGLGRRFNIGSIRVGNLTSISYSVGRLFIDEITRGRNSNFDPNTQTSQPEFAYRDQQSNQSVRIGVLHNWSFRFNPKHKIEFRNLFNQLGSSQTVFRAGTSTARGNAEQENFSLYYESRSIYSGQLSGEHNVSDKIKVDWLGGLAYTNRQEPDFRRYVTTRPIGSEESFRVAIPAQVSLAENGRFYSNLNEYAYTGAVNLEYKLGESETKAVILKAGGFMELKKRDFSARLFSLLRGPNFDPVQFPTSPTVSEMFDPNNIATNGFLIEEGTRPRDSYDAKNNLFAGYLALTIPAGEKWNFNFGARVEHNIRKFNSADELTPIRLSQPITSLLPSLNISYNINDKMLLRAAYARSINRPEFREQAPFIYYDFNANVLLQGNPNIKIANIDNVDLRWEYYPTPAELITLGVFYKRFDNPIEIYLVDVSNGTPTLQNNNADKARSFGVETEIRKSLETISSNAFLQKLSFVLNASLIYNRVDLDPAVATIQDADRPMLNQSPYLINAGLFYNDDKSRLQFNILYNVFGKRISIARAGAPGQFQQVYEMPRNGLDVSVTKGFGEKFELKLGVQNLLNAAYRYSQDGNADNKIKVNSSVDRPFGEWRIGQYVSLGAKYRF